jgi:hypothetical protein
LARNALGSASLVPAVLVVVMTTTDRYGRYVGRHMRAKDEPSGYAPGSARLREIAAWITREEDAAHTPREERYDRPVFAVLGTVDE